MVENPVYAGLEPREMWRHFAALNSIPRPSSQENAVRGYVKQVAEAAGATWQEDGAGNIVVRVMATSPVEASTPSVAVQAHLDMVCEKRPNVNFNFETDAIVPRREGDRIYASGTTLGADNGIGAAMALALLTTPDLQHGPLELLFTVEEETGLYGAMKLDPSLLQSRLLINLDSEDPKEITIGCAGGATTILRVPVAAEVAPAEWNAHDVVVSGLKGGHSGVQIHEPLANAIKLLTRVLNDLRSAGVDFRVVAIHGGSAHNAIPRDARASILVPPQTVDQIKTIVAQSLSSLQQQWHNNEPGLNIEVRPGATPDMVMTQDSGNTLLQLLDALPHGVLAWSEKFVDKVETSSNLAHVHSAPDSVEISTSSRSFIAANLQRTQEQICVLGQQAGAGIDARDAYPGWEPKADSRLLKVAQRAYEHTYGHAPQVEVVHAGLECGAIVDKLPGMEAVSFGPEIGGAHTPEEYVGVSSVEPTWQLLTGLLQSLNSNR
ncbi:MAG TPA: beta-Ala-His dipeptidase [Abditibacteriaceae bacterium]|jgi:dipeptidase D